MNITEILQQAKTLNTQIDTINEKNSKQRASKDYLAGVINKDVATYNAKHTDAQLTTDLTELPNQIVGLIQELGTSIAEKNALMSQVLEAEKNQDKVALETLLNVKLEEEIIKMPTIEDIDISLAAKPLEIPKVDETNKEVTVEKSETVTVEGVHGAPTETPDYKIEDGKYISKIEMYVEHDGSSDMFQVKIGDDVTFIYEGTEIFEPRTKEQYEAWKLKEAAWEAEQAANNKVQTPEVKVSEPTSAVEDTQAMFANLMKEAQADEPTIEPGSVVTDTNSVMGDLKTNTKPVEKVEGGGIKIPGLDLSGQAKPVSANAQTVNEDGSTTTEEDVIKIEGDFSNLNLSEINF